MSVASLESCKALWKLSEWDFSIEILKANKRERLKKIGEKG